jgi:predicted metal-dependent RNase
LLQHFGDEAPEHLHENVLDALKEDLRRRLVAMEPEPSWPRSRQQAAYKAILKIMHEAYEQDSLFNDSAAGHCILHDKDCPGFFAGSAGITMSVHGTACTAWSAQGKQDGACHHTVLP